MRSESPVLIPRLAEDSDFDLENESRNFRSLLALRS